MAAALDGVSCNPSKVAIPQESVLGMVADPVMNVLHSSADLNPEP